ncbi:hypothetical protein GS500_14845 [Rhodococcus hoagii]|nr:hypothetical protein [Prescottella equi]
MAESGRCAANPYAKIAGTVFARSGVIGFQTVAWTARASRTVLSDR